MMTIKIEVNGELLDSVHVVNVTKAPKALLKCRYRVIHYDYSGVFKKKFIASVNRFVVNHLRSDGRFVLVNKIMEKLG